MTASGSVSDFADTSNLQTRIAQLAGVDASFVALRVEAASVLIIATITVPATTTASTVQAALSSSLSTAEAASSALGITVETTPTITTSEDPGEDSSTLIIMAASGGGGAVLLLAVLIAAYCRRKTSRPHGSAVGTAPLRPNSQPAPASRADAEQGGGAVDASETVQARCSPLNPLRLPLTSQREASMRAESGNVP
jgi:hypothetical protein